MSQIYLGRIKYIHTEEKHIFFQKFLTQQFLRVRRHAYKHGEWKLTLTAAASYDVLQERVLGGYQAPAPPWHPFSLEWSRILVAALAIRTSASPRLTDDLEPAATHSE